VAGRDETFHVVKRTINQAREEVPPAIRATHREIGIGISIADSCREK
jgi:hypothetical protein